MSSYLKRIIMALESELTPTADEQPQDAQVTDVVMSGPLSVVYARALNLKYSKTDPVTGNAATGPAPETTLSPVPGLAPAAGATGTTAVATESQFNDLYQEAQDRANNPGEQELPIEDTITIAYPFGVQEVNAPAEEPTPVTVIKDLNETGLPGGVRFYISSPGLRPTDDSPLVGGQAFAIESYEIVVKLKKA